MRWHNILFTSLLLVTMSRQAAAQTNSAPGENLVRIYIPFALHHPVRESNGSVAKAIDGFGKIVDGNSETVPIVPV